MPPVARSRPMSERRQRALASPSHRRAAETTRRRMDPTSAPVRPPHRRVGIPQDDGKRGVSDRFGVDVDFIFRDRADGVRHLETRSIASFAPGAVVGFGGAFSALVPLFGGYRTLAAARFTYSGFLTGGPPARRSISLWARSLTPMLRRSGDQSWRSDSRIRD